MSAGTKPKFLRVRCSVAVGAKDEVIGRRLWTAKAGDIDTVVVDSLKALDPNRPIKEADVVSVPNDSP